jgi:hypothetical protein
MVDARFIEQVKAGKEFKAHKRKRSDDIRHRFIKQFISLPEDQQVSRLLVLAIAQNAYYEHATRIYRLSRKNPEYERFVKSYNHVQLHGLSFKYYEYLSEETIKSLEYLLGNPVGSFTMYEQIPFLGLSKGFRAQIVQNRIACALNKNGFSDICGGTFDLAEIDNIELLQAMHEVVTELIEEV